MSHFIDIVRRHAGWFFAAGWAFIISAIALHFVGGIYAAISAFYHPLHIAAPFHRFDRDTYLFAIAILATVAIVATILFCRKWRLSALVTMIAGCTALYVGLAVAKSFIMPGPSQFVRYIGPQRLVVPWQFRPDNSDQLDGEYLSVFVCWSNLKGMYGERDCRTKQIQLGSRSRGLTVSYDFSQFDRVRAETQREQDRHGLETFSFTPANEQDRILAATYFIGRDTAGKMIRFVRCTDMSCSHDALIGDYRLRYDTKTDELANWQDDDRRIAALIDTWRAP